MLGAAKPCEIPVAQWKLEEGTGNTTYDSIGANNGTLIRSPAWVSGYSGNALQFSGNNCVLLDYPVQTLGSNEVAISAWVKPAAGLVPGNYYPIITQYFDDDPPNERGYYLSLNGDYQPDFFLKRYCNATSPEPIDTDWHLLMGTYDGQFISIYVDGIMKATTYFPQQYGVLVDPYIGGDSVGRYFKGMIDEVEIYNCARECLPECHEDYDDWVLLGKPDCWCTPYQCDGDADVSDSGFPAYFRVYTGDLNLITTNWQKQAGDPTLNPCADVDHQDSGFPAFFRVYTNDLNIVVNNWQKIDEDLPGDCADCSRELLAGAVEAEIDFDMLIGRLEGIWLDPEVQSIIDQKVWDKIIKSVLKEARKQ